MKSLTYAIYYGRFEETYIFATIIILLANVGLNFFSSFFVIFNVIFIHQNMTYIHHFENNAVICNYMEIMKNIAKQ